MGTLATAYKALLEEKLNAGSTQRYAVYDYCADLSGFEKFWLDETPKSDVGQLSVPEVASKAGSSQEKALIIVWDSLPQDDGPAKFGTHLTPLDWALAFSTRVLKKKIKGIEFCIHIVDLTSTQFEKAFAMQMAASICEAMPWVKIYAPLPRGRRAYENPFPVEGLQSGEWPKADAMLSITQGSRSLDRLDQLNKAWQAWVVQSKDHHDVNNIIGPDILAKKGSPRRNGLPGAFLTRLGWTGYDLVQAADWESWKISEAIPKLFNRTLSVLVIDDQLQQGWGRFVCQLFIDKKITQTQSPNNEYFTILNANSKHVKIYGCLGSQPLINFLEKPEIFNRRDFSNQIIEDLIEDLKEPSPELILLDLRLYADKAKAKSFANALVNINKRVNHPGLAWPEIGQDEIKRIESWCSHNGSSDDENVSVEALLLLPRLLALALPLTPIILFSSTGKAWIRERLKPYQNIITSFEKPRVLSNPELVEASISALRDGLDKAVKMMRLRLQLAHAQNAMKMIEKLRPEKGKELSTQHVEIYADETRTLEEGIISGVAVCIFPDVDRAEKLQKRFIDEFNKAEGIVWVKKINHSNNPKLKKGSAIGHDKKTCPVQVEQLSALLKDIKLDVEERHLWTGVAMKMDKIIPEIKEVSLASFPDAPLDEALRFNLEFTLFVLIPFYSQGEEPFHGKIHIYIPTRQVELTSSEGKETIDFAHGLCTSFDLGEPKIDATYSPMKVAIPTFSIDNPRAATKIGTAFPLVRGWLHSWWRAKPNISKQITKLKMTVLDRKKGIDDFEASQRALFHDIADWVCTASNKDVGHVLRKQLVNSGLFPCWFVSTDTKQINGGVQKWFMQDTKNALILMRALKMSLTDDFQDSSRADVLRIALRNSYIADCNIRLLNDEYCTQQQLILWALGNVFESANGANLHALLADEAKQPIAKDKGKEHQVPSTTDKIESEVSAIIENEKTDCPSTIDPELEDESSEVLSSEQIFQKFPDAKQYFAYVSVGRPGRTMFCSADDSISANLTHSVTDSDIIQQLHLEGWHYPRIILGEEIEATQSNTKTIKVLASKLGNGKWQLFP